MSQKEVAGRGGTGELAPATSETGGNYLGPQDKIVGPNSNGSDPKPLPWISALLGDGVAIDQEIGTCTEQGPTPKPRIVILFSVSCQLVVISKPTVTGGNVGIKGIARMR